MLDYTDPRPEQAAPPPPPARATATATLHAFHLSSASLALRFLHTLATSPAPCPSSPPRSRFHRPFYSELGKKRRGILRSPLSPVLPSALAGPAPKAGVSPRVFFIRSAHPEGITKTHPSARKFSPQKAAKAPGFNPATSYLTPQRSEILKNSHHHGPSKELFDPRPTPSLPSRGPFSPLSPLITGPAALPKASPSHPSTATRNPNLTYSNAPSPGLTPPSPDSRPL